MAVDDVLQLAGVDVVARGDDHALDALAEVDEAVAVHGAQVAGVEPDPPVRVAAEGLGGLLRVVDVAHHDRGTGDADLALDVGLQLFLGADLDDFIIGIGEGHADGAGAGVVLGGQAGGRDAFRGAVALADLDLGLVGLQELVHLLFELDGQGVAAGEHAHQEAQVRVLQQGRPQQGLEERGDAGNEVGFFLDQQLGVGVQAEPGDQEAGAAAH